MWKKAWGFVRAQTKHCYKKVFMSFIVSFVFKIQVTKIWVQFKYKLSKGKLMGLFQNFVLSINPNDDEHCSLVGRDGNLLQNAKT